MLRDKKQLILTTKESLMSKSLLSIIFTIALSQASFASEVSIIGTVPVVVETSKPQSLTASNLSQKPKIVLLQRVKLSAKAKQALVRRVQQIRQLKFKSKISSNIKNSYPDVLDLGMNGTPVLDQGLHGSCVTFASAGAFDAVIGKGHYISELCALTLGNYIATKYTNYPSGWSGSTGTLVLNQFFSFGIISLEKQKSSGCGGLYYYPSQDPYQEGSPMTIDEYLSLSENVANDYTWQSILTQKDAFSENYNSNKTIDDVKAELNKGNRLIFGTLLDINYGNNGAVGTYHKSHDTWMLTPEIAKEVEDLDTGHQMIIIGYDDNAIIRSNSGAENKGLFILRNSWGSSAGDHGNYYMTYEHFKAMTDEVQLIKKKSQL